MKLTSRLFTLAGALLLAQPIVQAAQTATLTVETGQSGAPINHAMWGVFFEDINLGADGGLYAELVKNRSFEFPDPLMGWKALGQQTESRFGTTNPSAPCSRITSG